MPMRKATAVLATFTTLLTLAQSSAAHAATCTVTPRLNGSFVQPSLVDGFSAGQLTTEMGYLTGACITDQILQWTADSKANTTVYPSGLSGYSQNTSTDVVGRTLTAADGAGIGVYLGLQANNDWWNTYANDTTWLDTQATVAKNLAADLFAKYGTHSSLTGWYLPFEVDNWNFTTSATWTAMVNFYTTVAGYLHTLTPGKPVVISPFFNTSGGQTAGQWTTMWENILASAPIDVIALQDGIGAGHATNAQLATWFAATRTAISSASPSTALWADSETYNTSFQPQDIATVVADLQAEAPYVSRFWSFSYDHYDSPQQVDPAYDAAYRNYLTSGSVPKAAG